MTSVTFPTALGGDGSTVSDDADPTTGLRNAGYKTRFVPALQQTVNMTQTTVNKAAAAAASEAVTVTKAAEARASELAAAGYANQAMLLSLGVETLRPSIKPSLLLDFARAQVVPPSVTFTRASTATRVGPSGLIETVGINVPRLDYDPITRACLGLLVEEQRTNLLLHSNNFADAYWTKTGSTITASSTTSPDGTSNASKLNATGGAAARIQVSLSQVALNAKFVFSVFAKKGEYRYIQVAAGGTGLTANVQNDRLNIFDLETGAITANGGGANQLNIKPVGNGWYRISVTITTDADGGTMSPLLSITESPTSLVVPSVAGGVFIYQFDFEQGAFATSPVPTTAASVTRSADIPFENSLLPWFRTDEGTFNLEFDRLAGYNNSFGGGISYGGVAASGMFHMPSSGDTIQHFSSTPSNGAIGASIPNNTNVVKGAFAFDSTTRAIVANGGPVNSAVYVNEAPFATNLRLGQRNGGASLPFLCGHIRKLAFYPKRLSNAELQALTSL